MIILQRAGDVAVLLNPGPNDPTVAALSKNQSHIRLLRQPCSSRPLNSTGKLLSVFYANARSIVNKRHLLDLELATNHHDIIVLTETHLDDSVLDAELFPFD